MEHRQLVYCPDTHQQELRADVVKLGFQVAAELNTQLPAQGSAERAGEGHDRRLPLCSAPLPGQLDSGQV